METAVIQNNDFLILKSQDDLMIGGYASIEIVDKQNDLITLKALEDAVEKYMENAKFRNVMTNHSNVQVGEVVKSYRDKNGKIWKTEVDDVGFFVVIKLRDDIEKAKEINRGIRKGTLRSFSIGGQALRKVKKQNSELGEYSEISKLELHEVTICEKGINPEAKFDILKQEKEGTKMTDKLEKALEELDTLLEEVNTLRKEEEEKSPAADADLEMNAAAMDEELMDAEVETSEYMDVEYKAQTSLQGETGEPADRVVISGGKPVGEKQAKVIKAFDNGEITSLNLSPDVIEKAYSEYKAEQLEKIALGNLEKTFANRFKSEVSERETIISKANYDAKSEVSALKEELAELRKSFSSETSEILKSKTAPSVAIPSMDDVANMSWADLNRLAGN
ncbi:MAG: putative peptidase [Prokaryotic dsDNA virus sp.]|nr:MAG: putative peptidase [Prokaryotic dsDNA virus sp.]|tara:strand:- start:19420 stop:20595 length:1176 start_codon:yes stop_codon:yes gene_type:complete